MLDNEIRAMADELTPGEKIQIKRAIINTLLKWKKERISKNEMSKHVLHKIKNLITRDFYKQGLKPDNEDIRDVAELVFKNLNLRD